ncbi:ATP synthase subunit b [Alphaproteobacteria bacterium SO-S41]|nr:ATP synthase subunit b [Alphaproteobacteria bacterium SO-S41]
MAILIGLASSVLFAAAEGAAHATEAAHAAEGAEHKTGLPQLAIETFVGQLFWLAISFVFLFLVLTFLVIPRIRGVLETRRARVAGDLAAAAAAKGEADAALKAYEKAVEDARSRGRALAEDTRKATKADSDAKRAEAEAALAVKIADAEAQVAATKTEALTHIRAVASDTAAEIYARLTGETVTAADAASAVDAAMAR